MRTTLTLDDDVAALLRREQTRSKKPLKILVNEALRIGLTRGQGRKRPATPYRTRSVDLGRCLVGSLDNVAEVLALAEGEAFK
ncbi:MAG: DUF2191 domain-containing protein [Candidatus Rokuibacteriota bacterium]